MLPNVIAIPNQEGKQLPVSPVAKNPDQKYIFLCIYVKFCLNTTNHKIMGRYKACARMCPMQRRTICLIQECHSSISQGQLYCAYMHKTKTSFQNLSEIEIYPERVPNTYFFKIYCDGRIKLPQQHPTLSAYGSASLQKN